MKKITGRCSSSLIVVAPPTPYGLTMEQVTYISRGGWAGPFGTTVCQFAVNVNYLRRNRRQIQPLPRCQEASQVVHACRGLVKAPGKVLSGADDIFRRRLELRRRAVIGPFAPGPFRSSHVAQAVPVDSLPQNKTRLLKGLTC